MIVALVAFFLVAVIAWILVSFVAHLVLGHLLLIAVVVAGYLLYRHTRSSAHA